MINQNNIVATKPQTELVDAVKAIKQAILQSQYRAAKSVNCEQLSLYFGVGRFISGNSRKGFWGTGAIERISEQLQKELPGLRGFSAANLKFMRLFYEAWAPIFSTHEDKSIAMATDLGIGAMQNHFLTFLIQGYNNPMGVATYKSEEDVRKVLPSEEDLRRVMDSE